MKHKFGTLLDVFNYSTSVYAKCEMADFSDGGSLYTYATFKERCENVSRTLSTFGIGASDKVALLASNCPNWTVVFFSVTAFGRVLVPMLPDLSPNEVNNILRHSDSKAVFLSPAQLKKIDPEVLAGLHLVVNIEDFSLIKAEDESYTCDGHEAVPTPMDTAAIIYTSGTTGNAKGVMLCHRNFCANIIEAWYTHKVKRRDTFLSILPMAHTYEMSVGMLYPFSVGAKVYYIKKMPTPSVLLAAFKKLRPTTMLAVPLIIEKIYRSSVVPTIEKSAFLTFLKKYFPALLYFLVGTKLKKTFGGRMKFFGIGGSKLDPVVEAFLKKAHFPYAIGYGLTETAPLICSANPKQTCVGSIGKPAYGVEVRLDDVNPETGEGEIVAKGGNVMLGYYKDFARTRSVLSQDGWFHTGDMASMDKKGRYFIRGRLGSLILGASGENIYPEEIEQVINNYTDVKESLVIQREGHLVALVNMNDNVIDWNLEGQDHFVEEIEARQKAITEFVNEHVNKSSKIKEVEIRREPFVKTATQKIRRYLYTGKKPEKAENTEKKD